jgi:hypothetical protein
MKMVRAVLTARQRMQDKDCVDAIQPLAKFSGFAHRTKPIKSLRCIKPLRAQAAMAAAKNDHIHAN